MPRIDLQVPFNEKDAVKRLGARWDGNGKVWYVPDGVDARPFANWLPDTNGSMVCTKAKCYFIAEASGRCWKCTHKTRFFGFLLPAGTEVFVPDDEDRYSWEVSDIPFFIHYVTDIPPSAIARISTYTSSFRFDFSQTTRESYWMNHCDHCGMKQGDFGIHCEPQGALFPMDEQQASEIVLHAVDEHFSCNGNYSFEVGFFDHMRRA